eukprot:344051_1
MDSFFQTVALETDPHTLEIGSIIGFNGKSESNKSTSINDHNIITVGIIHGNININNCDIRDIENDKIYPNISWKQIYVLYSLNDDQKLFKNGDKCFAVWGNVKQIKKRVEHSYTTEYYEATFIRKDLRKREVTVQYKYGTNGETHTLPVDIKIYDFQYPTTVKPYIASYSEAYRKLKYLLSTPIQESPSTHNNQDDMSEDEEQEANNHSSGDGTVVHVVVRVCVRFQTNSCRFGSQCRFTHVKKDNIDQDKREDEESSVGHSESSISENSGNCVSVYDHASQLKEINTNELSKPKKRIKSKKARQKKRIKKILKKTRRKARVRTSATSHTQITASTKLEFLYRYRCKPNGSRVLLEMRRDGYIVGRHPKIYKWISKGIEYYKNLIAIKGDVYKFSIYLLYTLCICSVISLLQSKAFCDN